MAQDNFLSQLDNQSQQIKKQSTSAHFEDEQERLLKPDWENKKHKHRRTMLAKKTAKIPQVGKLIAKKSYS